MPSALHLFLILILMLAQDAHAHGGVVEEEDLCVIKVNYLRGHFKIYQPRIDAHAEYCEDLPNATESVFVMEYLHDTLAKAHVEFRIIRDVTGKGRFARWEDVAAIEDLDSVTVFYQEPTIEPDVLTIIHDFKEEGDYIGIVTASVDGDAQVYRAVFPFEVGFTGLGYWPLFIALVLIVQFQYFFMSGRLASWRQKRKDRKSALHLASLLLVLLTPALWVPEAAGETPSGWTSAHGDYHLSFKSSIEPIEINRMHSWVLHVTADGEPVSGAIITVVGGMPAHDHGLPTRPRITEELGGGDYRLDGMRFHMRGEWEVSVVIETDGTTDTVVIALTL